MGNYPKNRKPVSKEVRERQSQKMKEKWQNKKYRQQMSEVHKGQFVSEEKRKRTSATMTGMKRSEETRQKMSIASKKQSHQKIHEGRDKWLANETHEERMERLAGWMEAGKKARINHPHLKPSSIERIVQKQLDEVGIRYVQQKYVHDGNRGYYLDFYLPSLRLVLECNGTYWHSQPERVKRDKELERYVLSTGRQIVWLWDTEILDEWFDIEDYLKGGDVK